MDRSEIMRSIKSKDTKPELLLRKKLLDAGLRGYRLHWGEFKIDVAFVKRKIAMFYDSCFWHGCPEHFRLPKTRTEFWRRKIERNKRRDEEATRVLREGGWTVIRIWGHELGDFDPLETQTLAELSRQMTEAAREAKRPPRQ